MKLTNKNHKISRLLALSLSVCLGSCAFAPWQKSGVGGATPEERVTTAMQEVQKQPEGMTPRKDLRVTQEKSVTELLSAADIARSEARYDEAVALYGRVLMLAPQNERAISGKRAIEREQRHAATLEEARSLLAKNDTEGARSLVRQVLIENPQNVEALKLQQEAKAKLEVTRREPPRLKSPFDKPVTLELRDANIKMVFEALSRATGINFILDKDIKPDTKATVFVKKAKVEDAIDMVLASNGLQKKALSETSALVFPNTQQKLKDYQDLMIRSFYLTNSTATQIAGLLKTMLKTRDIFINERLNMLVIRDTPEVIRLAEKLVAANDLVDPEVMLEIEVLEVSRSRLQELGIAYPTQFAVATTASGSALTLEALRHINSGNISVTPNPAVKFNKTTGDVNLLSNPRIRVRNNEKAKILVGDKVPIITTTSTANVGVSSSVQYIDVGLKLDVEPRITLDDYVNIKVALEVSALGAQAPSTNGVVAYTIGTRNASTLLRLKDGETQVLAGLISEDERKNANKLPGLGDIPLLGRLFSDQTDSKDKTEIVLAITPHILGNISRPEAEISEYWSGTETAISDRPQLVVPTADVAAGRVLNRPQSLDAPPAELAPEPTAAEPQKEPPAPTNPPENAVNVPPAVPDRGSPSPNP